MAKHATLWRAVFFNRLSEVRDRRSEQQHYRASGLNLATSTIVLSNTTYLDRATLTLVTPTTPTDKHPLQYLSPLGSEHINLTGDYVWRSSTRLGQAKIRPLRLMTSAYRALLPVFCGDPGSAATTPIHGHCRRSQPTATTCAP